MSDEAIIQLLLVEDDERLASLTREYLERHDIVVSTAQDGERGLEEAWRHRYDVILLDLMLPGLSGIEVCKKIRERSGLPA